MLPSTVHRPLSTVAKPLRLGVLVSGKGTNLQAILDAIAQGGLDATVAYVACNHDRVQAIERAERAGIPFGVYLQKEYGTRQAQQHAIAAKLLAEDIDLVVCAGWDRIFIPEFEATFRGKIINIHPSLLPAFGGGLHAIRDALEYGVKVTGCTVHFVTDELDAGPIISQATVPILPDDDEASLAERIHKAEHRLLVEAIKLYAQGRLKIEGRTVKVLEGND
ncbi:MAG: phosphoribosylglycinamide formyltransferase [Chloroflexia bacterium]